MSIAMEGKLAQDEARDEQLAAVREQSKQQSAMQMVAGLRYAATHLVRMSKVIAANNDVSSDHIWSPPAKDIARHWMDLAFCIDAIHSIPIDYAAIVAHIGGSTLSSDDCEIVTEQVTKHLIPSLLAHSKIE